MAAHIELRRDAGRIDPTRGPWIREHQLGRLRGAPLADELVAVVDRDGTPRAWGLLSERSKIRIRVVHWGEAPPPPDWLERRIAAAHRDRLAWCPADTTGYRLVNAEGDGLPGLVVDDYDGARVVQATTAPMAALLPRIVAALRELGPGPVHVVVPETAAAREGMDAVCDVQDGATQLSFVEHGLRFVVAAPPAQKTGAYFDQRANRRWVAELAARPGAHVLDLGCHAGGFAVHAAVAGARVVAVDRSAAALQLAADNAARNDASSIAFVETDMFGPMAEPELAGPFSVIVADPPKVAASKRGVDAARSGMRRLVARLVARLAPGGTLLLCSCSHHFGRALLDATVTEVADGRLRRVGWRGADGDHPVAPGHDEGDYLTVGVYR